MLSASSSMFVRRLISGRASVRATRAMASNSCGPFVRWDDNVATSLLPSINEMGYGDAKNFPLFHDLVQERFVEFGEDVAIIDGTTEETRNFVQLAQDRDAVAAALQGMEFAAGEIVGLLSPNHCDYYAATTGTLRAGLTVTPMNPVYTAEEIATQLRGSNTRVLFTHADALEKVEEAVKDAPSVLDVIVLGDQAAGGRESLRSLIDGAAGTAPAPLTITNDATALLPYSSGTTGLPKGTMLSHRNLTANLLQSVDLLSQEQRARGDKVLSPLPMFHIYAFMVSLMGNVWRGVPLVTMKAFDFPRFLQLIEEHRITRLHVVPPIALGLAKLPFVADYDLSSCTHAMCAAAPLTTEVQQEVADRLGMTVKQGWGMSELSPLGTIELDGHPDHPGSVGPPCANTSVKVVNLDTGAALPPGEEGELLIKGPQVMKGYLNEPDKTAESMAPGDWFKTGDIAKIDGDGFVYITDRLKELIKYKGFQVAPAELEGLICTHPAVQDVTVIPRADEEAGEVPRAYVVLKAGVEASDETAGSIQAFVKEHASPTKQLRGGVVFTDAIPKTASGKILRREVIALDRQ